MKPKEIQCWKAKGKIIIQNNEIGEFEIDMCFENCNSKEQKINQTRKQINVLRKHSFMNKRINAPLGSDLAQTISIGRWNYYKHLNKSCIDLDFNHNNLVIVSIESRNMECDM